LRKRTPRIKEILLFILLIFGSVGEVRSDNHMEKPLFNSSLGFPSSNLLILGIGMKPF